MRSACNAAQGEGNLWQLHREQIRLGPGPPGYQGEAVGVVASKRGVRVAGSLPDLIVRNGISLNIDDLDQALRDIAQPLESDGEATVVKLDAAWRKLGLLSEIRNLRTASPAEEMT